MDTTNSLLDRLAKKNGGCSDYRLAKMLGLVPSSVGHYRAGRACFSDEVALHVARELGLEPGYVLACMMAERARTQNVKRIWEKVARAAMSAAVLGFLAAQGAAVGGPVPSLYIMFNRRRRAFPVPRASASHPAQAPATHIPA